MPLRRRRIPWFKLLLRGKCLDYPRQDQQQTQWCWAGVSAAVATFYDPATTWTQCAIANAELARNDCCGTGAAGACNVPWFLDRALTRVGHLASFAGGTLSFARVRAEIDAGRPVCARIGWAGGGGHFVALTCWHGLRKRSKPGQVTTGWVRVDDPWAPNGRSTWRFTKFETEYQGTGTWTHSYETS